MRSGDETRLEENFCLLWRMWRTCLGHPGPYQLLGVDHSGQHWTIASQYLHFSPLWGWALIWNHSQPFTAFVPSLSPISDCLRMQIRRGRVWKIGSCAVMSGRQRVDTWRFRVLPFYLTLLHEKDTRLSPVSGVGGRKLDSCSLVPRPSCLQFLITCSMCEGLCKRSVAD